MSSGGVIHPSGKEREREWRKDSERERKTEREGESGKMLDTTKEG